MLRDTNLAAWCAVGLLFEQYEAKHHGHALHILSLIHISEPTRPY